jgi:hypothetical protein
MSDTNERSCAARGSTGHKPEASRLPDCETGWNKQELIDEACRASFFGVPVGELSRTELLAAFGSLLKQKMYDQELADSVKNMFALAKRWQS